MLEIRLTEADVRHIVESVLRNIDQRLASASAGQADKARPEAAGCCSVRPAASAGGASAGAAAGGATAGIAGGIATASTAAGGATSGMAAAASRPSAPGVVTGGAASLAGDLGVFERPEDAIEAAHRAQREYAQKFGMEDRERIIRAIRQATLDHKEGLARRMWEETKLGRLEHKVAKVELTALKTPGTEDLETRAVTGDNGLTLTELAPYGVIGAITPVTNPAETIINNAIGMLAAGNSVVFNVHPSAKGCSMFTVQLINKAIMNAGGPPDLVTMVKEPTMETLDVIVKSPLVSLLVGTGGPGLVRTILASGKKAIGAGAGNPPVVVDETADLEHAAKQIVLGAAFDNNILCIGEKEVFVVDKAADELIFHLLNNGAYMLGRRELEQIMEFALVSDIPGARPSCSGDEWRSWHPAKEWIGKDARLFLERIGIRDKNPELLICEVDFDHPLVQIEQMMPILPIVRTRSLDEAIEMAVQAEHGNRHTAVMHSRNVDNLTKFARAIRTTIFVQNGSSLAGVGYGGEGFTTMTIAGPTGEGLTSARTYTRKIRRVLAGGGLRNIG